MTLGTLIIMLKAPVAGNVKTRLGKEVGYGRAAALFRLLTRHTIRRAASPSWRTILAIDPPSALSGYSTLWPPHLERRAQACGDLGARMTHAIKTVSTGPVIIIGADAPGLRPQHIRRAFQILSGADAVFGPAEDGGYWLIGLARRRGAPNLFEKVRWSTAHAYDDTRATLPNEYTVSEIDTLSDVDVAADLPLIGPLSIR